MAEHGQNFWVLRGLVKPKTLIFVSALCLVSLFAISYNLMPRRRNARHPYVVNFEDVAAEMTKYAGILTRTLSQRRNTETTQMNTQEEEEEGKEEEEQQQQRKEEINLNHTQHGKATLKQAQAQQQPKATVITKPRSQQGATSPQTATKKQTKTGLGSKSNQTSVKPTLPERLAEKLSPSNQTTVALQNVPAWVHSCLRWTGTPLSKGQPQWQVVGPKITTFVYSAHFDSMVSPPIIRVIGLLHKMAPFLNVTCHYYDDVTSPSVHHVSGVLFHFRGLNSRTYVGAHAECPLLTEKSYLPYAVSLRGPGDTRDTNFLKVHYSQSESWLQRYRHSTHHGTERNTDTESEDDTHNNTQGRPWGGWKWNITRCFPAFHRHYDNHLMLAEMVAASMTMGVQRFVFYVESAGPEVLRMLQMLQKIGLAEVYPWNLHLKDPTVYYGAQASAIQECFYRQLSSSRFVLFGDVDELFVPRREKTLLPLLSSLFDKQAACGAFSFRNVFFGLNRATQNPPRQWDPTGYARGHSLNMLLHTQRTIYVWPVSSRSKPAVVPARVVTPGIHIVYTFRKGYKYCEMDPNQGLLHHYKIIASKQAGPATEKQDQYLWHFAQDIIKTFQNLMQQFNNTVSQPYP